MNPDIELLALKYQVSNQLSRLSRLTDELSKAVDHVLADLRACPAPREEFWSRWEMVREKQIELALCRFAYGYPGSEAPPGLNIEELLTQAAVRTEFCGLVGPGEVAILNELATQTLSLLPPLATGSPFTTPVIYAELRERMQARALPSQVQIYELAALVNAQVARALLFSRQEILLLMPNPVAVGTSVALKSPARHGPDFRTVHWYGHDYSFTANQAAIVRILWEAFENGTPEVGHDYLRTETNIESPLREVFRDSAAWTVMIVQGSSKGSLRLCPSTAG